MLKPLGNRLILQPDVVKDTLTAGGIYIPQTSHNRADKGYVLQTSINREQPYKVGDYLFYTKTAGDVIKQDGKEYLILEAIDVLGRLYNKGEAVAFDEDVVVDDCDIFKLFNRRVLVKIKYGSEIYKGQIEIPDTADRVISLGTIAAISKEVKKEDYHIEIGTKILADCLSGHDVLLGKNRYKLLNPDELFGVEE